MIEINLLPGSERRTKRKSAGVALPKLPAMPKLDKWVGAIAASWILAPAILAWLFLGTAAERDELTSAIETAQADSARYARIIETSTALQARRDTIGEKLQIIQQIDAGRYIWAHVMDEVSRALPEYTWLTSLEQTSGGPRPAFRIEGRTGTTFALTRYLDSLESSPFISGVKLETTRRIEEEGRPIYDFVLTAAYEEPPSELVDMVPIFTLEDEADAIDRGAGGDAADPEGRS